MEKPSGREDMKSNAPPFLAAAVRAVESDS